MIRITRFAAPFLAALLAACAPRDTPPAPVEQFGSQAAPIAAVTPASVKMTPHPSSMPAGLRETAAPASGATVTVRAGETLSAIARRHSVPMSAIIQANNLKPPYGVQTGQKLALPTSGEPAPVFVASAKPAPERTKADLKPLAVRAAPVVAPLAEPVSNATVASAPRATVQAAVLSPPEAPKAPTAVGATLKVETVRSQPAPAPIVLAKAEAPAATAVSSEAHVLRLPARYKVEAETPPPASAAPEIHVLRLPKRPAIETVAQPPASEQHVLRLPPRFAKLAAETEVEPASAKSLSPKAALGEPPARAGRNFQWPVKGKLISSYGPQPGGLRNDGLNIAASRGEKVMAADNGIVAYAGDDLKGFGNLVLIKHAGGFVTTYAHNDKLMVKRGDKVRRGQVIATVGESGAVTQPQVHFQVRQGAHAVDPRPLMERS
jgi:murein DD-endopeptidase MepM/ murein hydrolase activator NlpD